MKKLTINIGILLISINSYGQSDSITFTRNQIIEMKNTIENILEWNEYDRERGETGMGSYEEGWGSSYWLTLMRDELYNKLNIKE